MESVAADVRRSHFQRLAGEQRGKLLEVAHIKGQVVALGRAGCGHNAVGQQAVGHHLHRAALEQHAGGVGGVRLQKAAPGRVLLLVKVVKAVLIGQNDGHGADRRVKLFVQRRLQAGDGVVGGRDRARRQGFQLRLEQQVLGQNLLLGKPAGKIAEQVSHLIVGQLVGNRYNQAVGLQAVRHLGKLRLIVLGDAARGHLAGQRGHARGGRGVYHTPAAVAGNALVVEQVGQRAEFAAQLADVVVDVLRHKEAAVFACGGAARDGQRVKEDFVLLAAGAAARTHAGADGARKGAGVFVAPQHIAQAAFVACAHGGRRGQRARVLAKLGVIGCLQGVHALVHGAQGRLLALHFLHGNAFIIRGHGQSGSRFADARAHFGDAVAQAVHGGVRHGFVPPVL